MRAYRRPAILHLDNDPMKSFVSIFALPPLQWLSLLRADICRLRTLNYRSLTPCNGSHTQGCGGNASAAHRRNRSSPRRRGRIRARVLRRRSCARPKVDAQVQNEQQTDLAEDIMESISRDGSAVDGVDKE
jgi:hypothetical protein